MPGVVGRHEPPDHAAVMLEARDLRGAWTDVDEDAARAEDPEDAAKGIDHAPDAHSSEGPREHRDVESLAFGIEVLRGDRSEPDVRESPARRLSPGRLDRREIRIDREDRPCRRRVSEREPSSARADLEHPGAARQAVETEEAQLARGLRPAGHGRR